MSTRREAWLLAQGDDIVPIPGSRSADRVAENTAAAQLRLTGEDLAEIARLLPRSGYGARFPEGLVPVWERKDRPVRRCEEGVWARVHDGARRGPRCPGSQHAA